MTRPAPDVRKDTQTLAAHLHFSPDHGQIQLFDQRMLLMHAAPLAGLRRDIVEGLGVDRACEMLTRLGWQQGVEDGQRVRALVDPKDPQALAAAMSLGPRLREIEGFVVNQPIDVIQLDLARGEFWGDYYWRDSWEAQAHLAHCGRSDRPVCWTMAGYADGYSTAVTGVPIQWREVECVAMGHACCRVIGRPLAAWQAEDERERLPARRRASVSGWRPADRAEPPAAVAPTLAGIVGASPAFQAVARQVRQVAPTDCSVLFKGESGVGKERFARAVHQLSPRAPGPWVAVNCAALPADLIEAELFGVERGAYTGADRTRAGRFERAHGGTLFLDEVASLSLAAQGKLLRALQEREIERVGGTQSLPVDVRVVAAANVDLKREVEAGRFRQDLFYRLNVFPIHIPPLRERLADLPALVAHFLARSIERHRKPVKGLTPQAHAALWDYDWPGNVRELENLIERSVILADPEGLIDPSQLFTDGEQLRGQLMALNPQGDLVCRHAEPGAADTPSARAQGLADELLSEVPNFEAIERLLFDRAVDRCDGNVSAVARLLQMGRGQVDYRLKKRERA